MAATELHCESQYAVSVPTGGGGGGAVTMLKSLKLQELLKSPKLQELLKLPKSKSDTGAGGRADEHASSARSLPSAKSELASVIAVTTNAKAVPRNVKQLLP